MFSSLQAGLQWRPSRRVHIALLLLALSPGFVPIRTVQECVCVRRARQGEGADLPQSDRGNDPTSADLIWRGGGVSLIRSCYRQQPALRLNSPQLLVMTGGGE